MLIIKVKKLFKMNFSNLAIGQCFQYEKRLYIKLGGVGPPLSVYCFTTNESTAFACKDTMVIPVNCTLTIKE